MSVSNFKNNNSSSNTLSSNTLSSNTLSSNTLSSNTLSSIDLSTTIGNIKMENPFINASGCHCMSWPELQNLSISDSGAFISKSCTPLVREGNPGIRYWTNNNSISINSMGLPNIGFSSYLNLKNRVDYQKPYFISLAGLTLQDNITMVQDFLKNENNQYVSGLEFNLSCPNIIGKGQLGYNFESIDTYLRTIFETELSHIPEENLSIGVKLPPYFDMSDFVDVADILKQYSRLNFVTCINSVGNGLIIDTNTETPVIQPKNGFGGIGGAVVKATALANVRQFYNLLGNEKSIIACGGVSTGEDAFQHILAGASGVSVGTTLQDQGPKVFTRLITELKIIMQQKKYNTILDFRGKLKPF